MAWKKIDDYNSGDTGTPFQPYSSFVAQGLTTNARSYPEELTRGGCLSWRLDKPVKWASYGTPAGTIFWANVGANAKRATFRVMYRTDNGKESEYDRIGTFTIRHVDSGKSTTVDVPAAAAGGYVDIVFSWYVGGGNGFQAFWIGFQSDIVDDLGTVNVHYIANNQMGLSKTGVGAGHYALTTGEKFVFIKIDEASASFQRIEHNVDGWQVGYIDASAGLTPDAIASVFPGDTYYPLGVGVEDTTKNSTGLVYELGAPKLYSISYDVETADPYTPPDQLSHYHALSLSSVNSAQSSAIPTFRPELANVACDPYHFGRIVTAAPDALTATFGFQYDVEGVVRVAFTVFPLQSASDNAGITTLSFDLLDYTGASIIGGPQWQNFFWTRYTSASTWSTTSTQTRALAGVLTGANEWGLRDALPLDDILKGNKVVWEFPSASFAKMVNASGVGAYTLKIVTGQALYIIGFSARLI